MESVAYAPTVFVYLSTGPWAVGKTDLLYKFIAKYDDDDEVVMCYAGQCITSIEVCAALGYNKPTDEFPYRDILVECSLITSLTTAMKAGKKKIVLLVDNCGRRAANIRILCEVRNRAVGYKVYIIHICWICKEEGRLAAASFIAGLRDKESSTSTMSKETFIARGACTTFDKCINTMLACSPETARILGDLYREQCPTFELEMQVPTCPEDQAYNSAVVQNFLDDVLSGKKIAADEDVKIGPPPKPMPYACPGLVYFTPDRHNPEFQRLLKEAQEIYNSETLPKFTEATHDITLLFNPSKPIKDTPYESIMYVKRLLISELFGIAWEVDVCEESHQSMKQLQVEKEILFDKRRADYIPTYSLQHCTLWYSTEQGPRIASKLFELTNSDKVTEHPAKGFIPGMVRFKQFESRQLEERDLPRDIAKYMENNSLLAQHALRRGCV